MKASKNWELEETQLELFEQICAGITVLDLDGKIRHYNREAARILDRKPEYIGREVTHCHKKQESIQRIQEMLVSFREGRQEPFHWEIERFGRRLLISFSPLKSRGRLVGCIHMAVVKPS